MAVLQFGNTGIVFTIPPAVVQYAGSPSVAATAATGVAIPAGATISLTPSVNINGAIFGTVAALSGYGSGNAVAAGPLNVVASPIGIRVLAGQQGPFFS